MTLEEVMLKADWAELRKQKQHLAVVQVQLEGDLWDSFEGLLSFIDHIQDAVVSDGLVPSTTVFPFLESHE